MIKYKVPVGAHGDCEHCDRRITYQGNHPSLGHLWFHDHNRSAWCFMRNDPEVGPGPKPDTLAEPKF